jgi:hypothetical protein
MVNFSVPWLDGLIEQTDKLDGAWATPVVEGKFQYVTIGIENTDGLDGIEPIMIEYTRQAGANVVIFHSGEDIHGATFYTPPTVSIVDARRKEKLGCTLKGIRIIAHGMMISTPAKMSAAWWVVWPLLPSIAGQEV